MEIIYNGPLTGAEAFSITASKPSPGTFTNYCYVAKDTQRYTANLRIEKEWTPYNLTLKAHRKGYIQFRLKGPYERNDYGEVYSIATDYKNLRIGDREIFPGRKKVTYVNDFSYRIPVNANDIMKISFDVRRHHIDADDFNLIKTKNVWYIITLSITVFVISSVLLRHLAVACRIGKAGDAFFLFLFFLLLAVPLSNISDEKKAAREERMLKQNPGVSLVLKEGMNYGKEFDGWFCDHLGGREWLIKLHDIVQRQTQKIIRGRVAWYMQESGWLFRTPIAMSVRSGLVQPIVSNLVELRNFCELNHIKFYTMVVPRKEDIYQERLYGYGLERRTCDAAWAIHRQIRHSAEKQRAIYIYPWMELREASKRDYTFFKLIHHWTDWGAYIGYRALMKEIRRDFPKMPLVTLGDYKHTQSRLIRDERDRKFHNGGLKKFFNFEVDRRCPSPLYNYYEHKRADKLMVKIGGYTEDFTYGGGAYKIMILGDSQSENLMGFMPYSAAQTRLIRINLNFHLPAQEQWKIIKHYKKDILSYKPDILVLLLWENHLWANFCKA